jgi:TonB family protein
VELLSDAIFLRGTQLILIILASILFLFIGYKLFSYGVDKGRSKLRHQSEMYKLIFSGSAPGLVFMVFGGLVLVFTIISFRTFSDGSTLKTEFSSHSAQPAPFSLIDIGIRDSADVKDVLSAAVLPGISKPSSSPSRKRESKSSSTRSIKRTLKPTNLSGTSLKTTYRSQTELSRVINNHNNAIEYCYKKESKKNPNLKGDLEVEFTIDYNGQVKAVRIIRSSMYNKKIEKCISSRIRGWRFKPIAQDEGDVKVRQKYIFG